MRPGTLSEGLKVVFPSGQNRITPLFLALKVSQGISLRRHKMGSLLVTLGGMLVLTLAAYIWLE